jgi:hypothetical protein
MEAIAKKDLEVFVDAWDRTGATNHRDTAMLQHGKIHLLLLKSPLQTDIAMSSTECTYTGLSHALQDAIPIVELLK